MLLAQCTSWGIVHHEYRCAPVHGEFEDTHNVWVSQANQGLCLGDELIDIFAFEGSTQDFEGRVAFEVAMLAQIDICKPASSQQTDEAVVSQLLSSAISHSLALPGLRLPILIGIFHQAPRLSHLLYHI